MGIINRATAAGSAAAAIAAGALIAGAPGAGAQQASHSPFIGRFHTISTIASTVPKNGDVNPYGVAVVQRSTGKLHRGDVLVSNFNNVKNQQGTGTTIVEVSPHGKVTQFARISAAGLPGRCPGGIGLTTALSVLSSGWVVVGSLPTTDGTSATARAGCLLVLDSNGRVRETFSGHGINGPWDMTALDFGRSADLFVTNVLNGTVAAGGKVVNRGTVLRLLVTIPRHGTPRLRAITKIGSGFAEKTDPAAARHRPDRRRARPQRRAICGGHREQQDRGDTRCGLPVPFGRHGPDRQQGRRAEWPTRSCHRPRR